MNNYTALNNQFRGVRGIISLFGTALRHLHAKLMKKIRGTGGTTLRLVGAIGGLIELWYLE